MKSPFIRDGVQQSRTTGNLVLAKGNCGSGQVRRAGSKGVATGEVGTGFRGLMVTRFKARLKLGDREDIYSELRTGLARGVGVGRGG